MSIIHAKGILSNKKDFFYYSADNDQWFRLLVRGGESQGYLKEIAIALTPPQGFINMSDVFELGKQFIKITPPPTSSPDDIYTHVLPYDIYDDMVAYLGKPLTEHLIDFPYIGHIDLDALLKSEKGEYLAKILLKEPKYDRVKRLLENSPGYLKNKPLGELHYV